MSDVLSASGVGCLFPVTSVCHSERRKVNSNCTALKTTSSHCDLLEEPDLVFLIKQRCSSRGDYLSRQLLAYHVFRVLLHHPLRNL